MVDEETGMPAKRELSDNCDICCDFTMAGLARVMRVVSYFTPNLEIYSIDEAFLSLAGFEARCEPHARELILRNP
jgi:hypothetical protein